MLRGWARARFEKTSTLRSGAEKGELSASADPEVLAQLASATIHHRDPRPRGRAAQAAGSDREGLDRGHAACLNSLRRAAEGRQVGARQCSHAPDTPQIWDRCLNDAAAPLASAPRGLVHGG